MKTRATKSSGKPTTENIESTKSAGPKVQLGADSTNPSQLFVLPEGITKQARIVTLQNPRFLDENRYVVCPERGFYEFKAFTEPKTTPRSWLLSQEVIAGQDGAEGTLYAESDIKRTTEPKGYVTRNANLFIATPIDSLFLILPALAPLPTSKSAEAPNKLFLTGDDYLEKLASASPQLNSFLRTESIRVALEKRMTAVCDTVEAGDETMYRLNEGKLLDEILRKAKKMMGASGLPASMEEKLVRKALDVPILGINREESLQNRNEEDSIPAESGSQTSAACTPDTQTTVSSTDTATSSFAEASTAATSFTDESLSLPPIQKLKTLPAINAPDGVADLLRLRTALFFICSNYVPPHLSESIKKMLVSSSSKVDFSRLDSHLAHLARMRQEAVSIRSLGDFSRKRSMIEDEDSEIRAEKKRKKEEEEKRNKSGVSRGVKNLKKVNTSGMKKMSDFFKKK
jgi:Ydr279p protein family (RNase H2 complex component) wHTH domain/Ydr279p protein triple barrel domain